MKKGCKELICREKDLAERRRDQQPKLLKLTLHSLLCRAYRGATASEQKAVAAGFGVLEHDAVIAVDPTTTRRRVKMIARQRLADILNANT